MGRNPTRPGLYLALSQYNNKKTARVARFQVYLKKAARSQVAAPCAVLLFFLKMEACPPPLHHDDACSHFIKNPRSIVIIVLQLANEAEQSKKGKLHADKGNRYGNMKDKLPRLLSCYVSAIRTG